MMLSKPRGCAWLPKVAARRRPPSSWVSAPSYALAGSKRSSSPKWQRGSGAQPGGAPAARPAQTGRAGARHVEKSLGHLRPANPVSTYRYIAQRQLQVPVPSSARRYACRLARIMRGSAASCLLRSQLGKAVRIKFRDLVAHHKAVQRMSRRGNYYDNAHAESFWRRLKPELLDGSSFRNLIEARLEISTLRIPVLRR
jgi:hypothetical protein